MSVSSKEASHNFATNSTTHGDDVCTDIQSCTGSVKLDVSPGDRTMQYGSDVSPRTTKPSLCTMKSETDKDVCDSYGNTKLDSVSVSGSLFDSDKRVSDDVSTVCCVNDSKVGSNSPSEGEYNSSDPVDHEKLTEPPKMAFEATERTDLHAQSDIVAASESKLHTSQEEVCVPQTKNSDGPENVLSDVKEEKDGESVGSPGTPLLDEQPYSPCLNVPDCMSDPPRKDKLGTAGTEPKSEFDDNIKAAKSAVTQPSIPLSDVAVSYDNSILNHTDTDERSCTPPLVMNDDIHSQTQSVLEDSKKTTSSGINSTPSTVSNCSIDTGATKTEPLENKLLESRNSFVFSDSGINSQITVTLTSDPVTEECGPCSQDIGAVVPKEEEKAAIVQSRMEFTDDKKNLSDVELKHPDCENKCTDTDSRHGILSTNKDVHRRHSSSSGRSGSGHRSSKDKSEHSDKHREKKFDTSTLDSSSHGRRSSDAKETDRKERSHSSSSSDRKHHCSRCYKRSKIKRASIGVQCRRDKTIEKYVKYGSPDSSSLGLKIDFQTKHFSLPRPLPYTQPGLEQLKYGRFIRIETYANGGATIVHMYQDEIDCLNREEMEELAQEYFKVSV